MKTLQLLLALVFIFSSAIAQSQLNLPPDDPESAKEKYVLLSDHYDSEDYEASYASFVWIMEFAPNMHESVYVIGVKAIRKLLDQQPENNEYKEALLKAYDHRITHFGNEIKVLNRKAYDAYKYLRKDPEWTQEIIQIFDRIFEVEGAKMKNNLLYPYFDLNILLRKNEVTTDEELIISYERISNIINSKLENGENENLEKIQKLIDAKLAQSVQLDCKKIEVLFGNPSSGKPLDLHQSKLIIKLSVAYKCSDKAYFIDAIKVLFDADPTLKFARIIASYHVNKNEYDSATNYYSKALDLTQDQSEKASIYFDMANIYSVADKKMKAREMANKSLALDPSKLENYRLIGDLYFNSYDDCKKGKSRVEDRSVFYAAYEKYIRAKDPTKMNMAEQQFPSMETIHTENFDEGQVINTKCWMGEPIKIRRRPPVAN